jgi:hypothetical protein
MTSTYISIDAAKAFYRAALIGLRFLQLTKPPRPDSEADIQAVEKAPYEVIIDKIDDLLSKASVMWGVAFSPAQVFMIPGLAAEEQFGPDWPLMPQAEAKTLWDEIGQLRYDTPRAAFADAATAWGVTLQTIETGHPDITPAKGVLIAGPSALATAIDIFSENKELNWARQVMVVASRPRDRQLAGLAGAFVSSSRPTRLIAPDDANAAMSSPAQAVFRKGQKQVDTILVSADAKAESKRFAEAAKEGFAI